MGGEEKERMEREKGEVIDRREVTGGRAGNQSDGVGEGEVRVKTFP